MKLATTTGDFDRFTDSYLQRVKYVESAGFKYIDLSLYNIIDNDELMLSDNWKFKADELKSYADKNKLQFVQCHSPNTNPIDKKQFERAVSWNIRSIELCGMLGIKNMVVHSGWDVNADKSEWYARNKAFFERLLETAEKNGVNVLHENTTNANMPWFYPKTGAEMREFSEFVNHPNFHSCWDTGHANIEGNQYDEIVALGDDLYAVHISDNRGLKDEHIIPFMGTVNMDEIMQALQAIGFKGSFTFEAGSALRPKGYWLGNRREFSGACRLSEPTAELQLELERFMYSVGRHILNAYGEL